MLRCLTFTFAFIGFLTVVLIGGGIYAALHYRPHAPVEPASVLLTLDFDQPVTEQVSSSPLNFALDEQETPLLDILRAIDKAKLDPHVKGIVARFGSTQPDLAEAEEIRAAILSFRAAGKPTYAFAPSYGDFGEGNRAYYLASAFQDIWLQPVGSVSLTGLSIQEPFGKTALDKIGVKADFMQREEYKSFMDMATRDDFAPPVKDNMQSILDSIATTEAADIAENRGWDEAHVRDLMARGPYTDDEALKEKLVTRLGYADELEDELKQKLGDGTKSYDVEDYLSFGANTGGKAEPTARVALIYGTGMIVAHNDDSNGVTGDKIMGADSIADAFDTAADDNDIKAILFRIDSPGGTPEASETIRRAVIHAQRKGKPVFVSMAGTAASGGYWVAMNAERIVAEPATLTGSIGVLAGKFEGADLLQKIGVNMPAIKTAENADMWSPSEPFTQPQRDRVNALLDNSYHAFTHNVSEARHIPEDKMPDIAKGRVWTGAQAVKIGLVDELGGFGATLISIRKKLNLSETDTVELEIYPPPETPMEKLRKLLKNFGVEEALLRPIAMELPQLANIVALTHNAPVTMRAPVDAGDIR